MNEIHTTYCIGGCTLPARVVERYVEIMPGVCRKRQVYSPPSPHLSKYLPIHSLSGILLSVKRDCIFSNASTAPV